MFINICLKVISLIVVFQIIHSSTDVNNSQNLNVKLTIYYESLCSDSKKFITTKLAPIYPHIKEFVDLKFKPFGKANVNTK